MLLVRSVGDFDEPCAAGRCQLPSGRCSTELAADTETDVKNKSFLPEVVVEAYRVSSCFPSGVNAGVGV